MQRFISNTFWLMLAHVGGVLIPLLELPILVRALGTDEYGKFIYALGLTLSGAVFIEFGFSFSASRELVKRSANKKAVAELVTDVLMAKFLLMVVVLTAIGIWVVLNLGQTKIPDSWMIWMCVFIFSLGFSPMWYYIGVERLVMPAFLDLTLRLGGVLLIWILVTAPEHAYRALVIQSVVCMVNTLLPLFLMVRETGLAKIRIRSSIQAIRNSWELFLYKGAQNVLGSLAPLILGSFVGPRAVSSFIPAEKLVRAITGLTVPILNVAYPSLIRLHSDVNAKTKRTLAWILVALLLMSMPCIGLVIWLAPWLINTVFGAEYMQAVAILSVLIFVIPIRVCNMVLAILWFIPKGQERLSNRLMLVNIGIVLSLSLLLIPFFGVMGMAITFLSSEIIVFLIFLYFFLKK